MVIPLQTRGEHIIVKQVATKDRLLIEEFEFWVFHKVDPGPEEMRIQSGQFAYNRDIILQKIWAMSGDDWSGAVKALSETAARDVVGRYDLEQIVAIANQFRVDFKEALKQQINRVTKDFMGVDVIAVDVGKIKVPEDAEKRLLEKRVAEWDKGIGTTKAETERIVQVTRAMTRMQTIQAISQGLRQLLGQQATPGDLIAMRFIEYLEKKAEMPDATGEDDIATLLKLQGINSLGALRSNRGRRRKR
jgi:hypothetical protein